MQTTITLTTHNIKSNSNTSPRSVTPDDVLKLIGHCRAQLAALVQVAVASTRPTQLGAAHSSHCRLAVPVVLLVWKQGVV